mmetsp:Transcript_4466/g.6334  ORF Transcript_4466/g.6334 Transcript_4466/m.6334 type:complete len:95 (+) Transcript_4466:466-750(+)
MILTERGRSRAGSSLPKPWACINRNPFMEEIEYWENAGSCKCKLFETSSPEYRGPGETAFLTGAMPIRLSTGLRMALVAVEEAGKRASSMNERE